MNGEASTLQPLTCSGCGGRFGSGPPFVRRVLTLQRADGSVVGSWCGPCDRGER